MAESLIWTGRRTKGTSTKTGVTSVSIPARFALSWAVFGPMLGILSVAVLFLALNTCFLPITCTLTGKGCEVDKHAPRDGDRTGIGGETLVFRGTREDRR
jgi:hypothetical protein